MSAEPKMVGVAHAEVAAAGEVLVAVGLGSCVAILLHDPERELAGMAHVLLPAPPSPDHAEATPEKFASTAVPFLVQRMESLGAERGRMVARLVGGASMFSSLLGVGSLHTGERNVLAAREALQAAGIPVVAEEVGREHGRSVTFFATGGRVRVRTVHHGDVEL